MLSIPKTNQWDGHQRESVERESERFHLQITNSFFLSKKILIMSLHDLSPIKKTDVN